MLHTGKCSNPMTLVNHKITVMGYEDPALEGDRITLTCQSNSSIICMGTGEWELNPGEVVCIGELMTTGTTLTGMSPKVTFILHVHA